MKRFLWILSFIVLALSACDGSDVPTQAPQLSDEVQRFDNNSSSSSCRYNVAQIQKELANLSRMAQQGRNVSWKLGLQMIEAQNVLADSSCTQEITQFKIRETLEFANVSQEILNVESCYTGARTAQNTCHSTATLYDDDTSDCDIDYQNQVNQCYRKFSIAIDKVCINSQESCESVKDAHQPR